jgi:predicted DNA-binding protein
MRSRRSEAFATRLPERDAQRLEAVVKQTGETDSAVLRRAVQFYLNKNPDEIPELYPAESGARFIAELLEERRA